MCLSPLPCRRSPGLFDRFLTDVLTIKLGFHDAQKHELPVLKELARHLLQPGRGAPASAPAQSCVRVLLLPRNHDGMKALTQAMAILQPLRFALADMGDAATALAAACLVGREAVAAQDGKALSPAAPGVIVGAETLTDFGRILTAAAVELSWRGFMALATDPKADDDDVQVRRGGGELCCLLLAWGIV